MQENKPPGDPKTGDPETNEARRQRMAEVAKTSRPGEDPHLDAQKGEGTQARIANETSIK